MLISTTQRECSRRPRRAASVLFGLPSIFKCLQMYLSSRPAANLFEQPVFQHLWISRLWGIAEGGCRRRQKAVRGAAGDRRGARSLFTYPWGIHFPDSLSIRCIKRSMAACSEIKHNSSRQAGKQAVFSEKCILCELKFILSATV